MIYIRIFVALIVVAFLIALTVRKGWHKKVAGSTPTNIPNGAQLTVGWISAGVALGLVFGWAWWGLVFSLTGTILIVILTIGGYMTREDKKNPFRYKLAWVVILLGITVAIWHVAGQPDIVTKVYTYWANTGRDIELPSGIPAGITAGTDMDREATQLLANKIFYSYLGDSDAAKATKVVQYESDFRQFEDDGVTPLKNKKGSTAIGLAQIKPDVWSAKAQSMGYDLNSREGNLLMMVYIVTKEPNGWDNWSDTLKAIEGAKDTVETYTAPAYTSEDSWSQWIPVRSNCHDSVNAPATVESKESGLHDVRPLPAPQPTYVASEVRYRSQSKTDSVTVTFTCTPH